MKIKGEKEGKQREKETAEKDRERKKRGSEDWR